MGCQQPGGGWWWRGSLLTGEGELRVGQGRGRRSLGGDEGVAPLGEVKGSLGEMKGVSPLGQVKGFGGYEGGSHHWGW